MWKLDRLGRNTRNLLELLDTFKAKGIKFRSLCDGITTDPDTELGGAMAQAMITIVSAFAQLERDQPWIVPLAPHPFSRIARSGRAATLCAHAPADILDKPCGKGGPSALRCRSRRPEPVGGG